MQLTGFLGILKPFIDLESHTHARQIFLSADISNLKAVTVERIV